MIKCGSVDNHEILQVVLVRRIIPVPGYNVEGGVILPGKSRLKIAGLPVLPVLPVIIRKTLVNQLVQTEMSDSKDFISDFSFEQKS